jgi:hypothetical protein
MITLEPNENIITQEEVDDFLTKDEITALLKGIKFSPGIGRSELGQSLALSYDTIERILSEPEVASLLVQLTDQSIPLHRWKEIVHDFVRVVVSTINN